MTARRAPFVPPSTADRPFGLPGNHVGADGKAFCPHLIPPKRSKYGARKTVVDGITFDSAAEARRYGELKLLEKGGYIRRLELQPVYEFKVDAGTIYERVMFKYVADFRYREPGCGTVVEDVKGVRTPVYRLKKKLIEAQFGIKITEVS